MNGAGRKCGLSRAEGKGSGPRKAGEAGRGPAVRSPGDVSVFT